VPVVARSRAAKPALVEEGFRVAQADSLQRARSLGRAPTLPSSLIPDGAGWRFSGGRTTEAVVITARRVASAVAAPRAGAIDYLTSPRSGLPGTVL
jgi:hypothetical protein